MRCDFKTIINKLNPLNSITHMTTVERIRISKAAKILKSNVAAFRNLDNAESFCNHCNKIHLIVEVENEYWVQMPAEAQRLNNLGYKTI